ncbi:MAG: AbrB/MazE/SpoVT family DNA-binding domain-containing protein [Candidatus Acidiferrales bacterium]|jgi:AbrB family looped-hinge helix DNA binding protein
MSTPPKILKTRVKVSPKFQIVVPKAIREEMKLEPGQELFMYLYEGKLQVDTLRPVTELRGIAKGMKWRDDYRDRNDRF